jgi:hypothetical protein
MRTLVRMWRPGCRWPFSDIAVSAKLWPRATSRTMIRLYLRTRQLWNAYYATRLRRVLLGVVVVIIGFYLLSSAVIFFGSAPIEWIAVTVLGLGLIAGPDSSDSPTPVGIDLLLTTMIGIGVFIASVLLAALSWFVSFKIFTTNVLIVAACAIAAAALLGGCRVALNARRAR